MRPEEIVSAFESMEPEALKEVTGRLARLYTVLAENLYDKNPTENGLLAQPYADLASLFTEASQVFDEPSGPSAPLALDNESAPKQPAPVTVTSAAWKANERGPWGKL